MKLTSSAFAEGGAIPAKYTCDGENVSPPLAWTDVPQNTGSLALIVHDPDAPAGDWVHWVVCNVPPSASGLPEHTPSMEQLFNGAVQGRNDFKKVGYGGPCPPGGTHRYFFRLYALDAMLPPDAGSTRQKLEAAMKNHIVAESVLMGTYKRRK